MGSCFSKKKPTTTTTPLPPPPQTTDHHHQPPITTTTNNQPALKKEIFVIKHRISHEIDRHSNQEPDPVPLQPDRLTRSNSAGPQNPTRRRRHSRSKRSFDEGFNKTNYGDADVDNDDDVEVRVSSSGRYRSKERRISISPSRTRGSSSKERRISISPSRRSESPFSNKNLSSGSGNRPAKMVSVPATNKGNNAGVKRINVKRNVSPARTSIRVFNDDCSEEQESSSSTREADWRRKSLVEIDNNAGRCVRMRDGKRSRRLSRDLDAKPETETGFDDSQSVSVSVSASPPSYASLLLEDIQKFHKKNTSAATTKTSFAIPECVSKACLIMEAVADMNSNSSSLCSDDRWRNPATVKKESPATEFGMT